MSQRVSVSKFDEIRGKFKRHRNNIKTFTKEKQTQMEMEHNTLMEATKEIQRIRELNEMDISSSVDRQKKFEKMRKKSMKQLRKKSTANVQLTSTLQLTDGDVFGDKFVPLQSS